MPRKFNTIKFNEWIAVSQLSPEEKKDRGFTSGRAISEYLGIALGTYDNYKARYEAMRDTNTPDEALAYKSMMKERAFGRQGTAQDRFNYGKLIDAYPADKKEETLKFEVSSVDKQRLAAELLSKIRENYTRHGGNCPVCLRPEVFRGEVCESSKSEQSEGGEVAALAIST